jgi:hypothetical protein
MKAPESGAAPRLRLTRSELQMLADKVYRLMQADVRLEQARGASTPRRKER